MITTDKITDQFTEIYNDGYKQIYIRNFGKVIPENDKEVRLFVIAEIYNVVDSGAVAEKEVFDLVQGITDRKMKTTPKFQLSICLLPDIEHLNNGYSRAIESDKDSLQAYAELYEYCGGLRYDPIENDTKRWFYSEKAAKKYLDGLDDRITGEGFLSGFIMDQHYNRMGETNWDILNKMI